MCDTRPISEKIIRLSEPNETPLADRVGSRFSVLTREMFEPNEGTTCRDLLTTDQAKCLISEALVQFIVTFHTPVGPVWLCTPNARSRT